MAGTCGGTLVKLLLALFNFVWLAIGSFVIYLGVQTLQFNDDSMKELIKTNISTGALVLIIFGAAVVLIAAIGFLGACCESSTLLNFYGLILLALLVVNIAGLYYGYKYKDDFQQKFSDGVQNGIRQFDKDPKLAYALQKIQTALHCCGWEGPGDYSRLIATEVPASCCKDTIYSVQDPYKKCSRITAETSGYSTGCKNSPVVSTLTGNITYTAYALILIQLVVILASCCLARDLNAKY